MLTVVCVDDNCKWMLRASTVKQSAIFMIRKFVAVHTCSLDFRRNAHWHATSAVIAEHILGKLDTPYRSYPPTHIARDMEHEFGVKISYSKARRGKLHTLNMLHAFGASIHGYMQYLRPVICVDGSHLKCPYKGTLLVATAQNGNKQIYPLAWGIVDTETNKSWKWFLSNLKDLIGDSEELVFVSDRKSGYMQYLRPVICVDGSHLKCPYKGTLLVATAQNGNKQIYPLAWGIVDTETNKSWKWFLSNLKDLIGDSEELVFVSDRKKSIQKAISQLFSSSRHGCCI
ncbi:uncharacterized protein LOC111404777 [Olea europaea var. sylvestris]|uniref:uncharacterized protein LOC111404777 n=1 Tax=Olea europaea var. sylvestris TaxID=158386 RepID=UPI000C1D62DE|nr:uncharacterized protein LOC111404777 [Olea europaea var. sylvestris]